MVTAQISIVRRFALLFSNIVMRDYFFDCFHVSMPHQFYVDLKIKIMES